MQRFKLITATAIALMLSLALAATVAAASNQSAHTAPSGLTAEFCGDAVCLNWTPGTGALDVNQIQVWEGDNANSGRFYGSMAVDEDGQARIPIHYLFIKEPQSSADHVAFSFQVLVIKYDNYYDVEYAAKSNLVTLDVLRPGIVLDVDLCEGSQCNNNPPH